MGPGGSPLEPGGSPPGPGGAPPGPGGAPPGPAWPALAERIRRHGPISFGDYVEGCLYGPGGFYLSGSGAGRVADFVTSPTLGPLFGAVLARAIDAEWERCGRPDPWVVVEAGAGSGELAQSILAAGPACAGALRYVAVEISPALRAVAADRLPAELPALVLGPRAPSAGEDDEPTPPLRGRGPLVTVLDALPAQPVTGMVVANELLDNLLFDLVAWNGLAWQEVRVGEAGDRPVQVVMPASPELATAAARLVAYPPPGARIPLQRGAREWLEVALGRIIRGRIICVDYCSPTTARLAERDSGEWLRTYRGHARGFDALAQPGAWDITCEVAVDQLASVRRPTSDRSQSAWVTAHGLDALVAEARDAWSVAAARPDVAALMARSRVVEADALTDPSGLGAFRVLEWEVA